MMFSNFITFNLVWCEVSYCPDFFTLCQLMWNLFHLYCHLVLYITYDAIFMQYLRNMNLVCTRYTYITSCFSSRMKQMFSINFYCLIRLTKVKIFLHHKYFLQMKASLIYPQTVLSGKLVYELWCSARIQPKLYISLCRQTARCLMNILCMEMWSN